MGRPRSYAQAKHNQWIIERRQLEQNKPADAAEVRVRVRVRALRLKYLWCTQARAYTVC